MTSISKNVCINKLDDIVNKDSNIYHRAKKMNSCKYIDFNKAIMINILYLKLVILKKFLQLKKVKNVVPWTHVISDLRGELQKNCKKQIKKSLELTK